MVVVAGMWVHEERRRHSGNSGQHRSPICRCPVLVLVTLEVPRDIFAAFLR